MSQKNPFCRSGKRKRKSSTTFPTERKAALAESDRGSYYNQKSDPKNNSRSPGELLNLKELQIVDMNLLQEDIGEAAVCKEWIFN